jgi:catechol 2,3-dioxygenase-like lactoylglutathione lyase family enzyme
MFKDTRVFTSFSVDDLKKAADFYATTLGLDVKETPEGLSLTFCGGGSAFIYPKADHRPATYTILNFPVQNLDDAVAELSEKGITFEKYGGEIQTDEKGIFRGGDQGKGPNIAWFKDPAGNILSLPEMKLDTDRP